MGGKPHISLGAYVIDQLFENHDSRAVADVMRVHGEEEHRAFLVRLVELVDENLEHIPRRAVTGAPRVDVDGVV